MREWATGTVSTCPGRVTGLGGCLPSAWSVMTSHSSFKLGLMPFPLLGLLSSLLPCFPKPLPHFPEILFILQVSSGVSQHLVSLKLHPSPACPPPQEIPLSGLLSQSLVRDSTNTEYFLGGTWERAFRPACNPAPRHVPDSYVGCARMTILSGTNCNTHILVWNLESGWFHRSPQ